MSENLGIGDAQDLIVALETKIDGLADEFDAMGDEHDTVVWLLREVSEALLPRLMMTIQAMAAVMAKVIDQTGVTLDSAAPVRFIDQPNRAQRRREARNGS